MHYQSKFVSTSTGALVRFGGNAYEDVKQELERLGAQRALFLSTPEQSDTCQSFSDHCRALSAGVFTEARMHTPVDVTESAVNRSETIKADCLVSIGGGSTTGLGKAIAYRTDLPQIVVPTTYAGSECTSILGQTEYGRKTTLKDPRVLPEVVVYDPMLVASLPVPLTVTSALNAMAHAVEALYAKDRDPESTMLAIEGLIAFAEALSAVIADPNDLDARSRTLYGAWLCGTVLGQVSMALHHKLCHTLTTKKLCQGFLPQSVLFLMAVALQSEFMNSHNRSARPRPCATSVWTRAHWTKRPISQYRIHTGTRDR
jgi:maleylacetate reductase